MRAGEGWNRMRVWLAPKMRTARTGFGADSQRSFTILVLAIGLLGWQSATALAALMAYQMKRPTNRPASYFPSPGQSQVKGMASKAISGG